MWFSFICFADAQVVLQVAFDVQEASGSHIIAAMSIMAISIGVTILVAIDAIALKASISLFASNIRYIVIRP